MEININIFMAPDSIDTFVLLVSTTDDYFSFQAETQSKQLLPSVSPYNRGVVRFVT